MINKELHIIYDSSNTKEALEKLNILSEKSSKTLFVLNHETVLLGTITDGDIRRNIINGEDIESCVNRFMNKNFHFLRVTENVSMSLVSDMKKKGITLLPILDEKNRLVDIYDLTRLKCILPVTVVLMAGGKGERLRPLTNDTPKPMLKIGEKPILEINIDRLIEYGVKEFFISINYLGDKIESHLGNGKEKGVEIRYLKEDKPLGTIGALSLVHEVKNDTILMMNGDILTNLDFEDFYKQYVNNSVDICVASVPYKVNIPYGIMDLDEHGNIISLTEKPSYTFFSNAGIYIFKSQILSRIPKNSFYNATDVVEQAIRDSGLVVKHFPIRSYWLDIGTPDDFLKAQDDFTHLKL
jgi:dTDP-glucose pyrophosphorylase